MKIEEPVDTAVRLVLPKADWQACETLAAEFFPDLLPADVVLLALKRGLHDLGVEAAEALAKDLARAGVSMTVVRVGDKPVEPKAERGAWRTLKVTDPRTPAAREAIRAEWRKRMAASGKPFGGLPRVNALKVTKDGTKVRGNIVISTKGGRNASTWGDEMRGVEADLPGGPAPKRLMDRFNRRKA